MCKRDRIIVLMDDERNVGARFKVIGRAVMVAAAPLSRPAAARQLLGEASNQDVKVDDDGAGDLARMFAVVLGSLAGAGRANEKEPPTRRPLPRLAKLCLTRCPPASA